VLELLRQFTAVKVLKDLYLFGISTQSIVPTLEALIGGEITDVLPAVQNILLESIVVTVSGLVQALGGLSLHDSSPVPLLYSCFPLGSSVLEPFKGSRTFMIDKFFPLLKVLFPLSFRVVYVTCIIFICSHGTV
jgi:hypothetical protein